MMDVSLQPEIGDEVYASGGKILEDFFRKELAKFDVTGMKIIGIFRDNGSVYDFEKAFG
jgi:hypothetical protein